MVASACSLTTLSNGTLISSVILIMEVPTASGSSTGSLPGGGGGGGGGGEEVIYFMCFLLNGDGDRRVCVCACGFAVRGCVSK